ncbi:hypothetical protein AAZX31_06G128900 [Glycine max]
MGELFGVGKRRNISSSNNNNNSSSSSVLGLDVKVQQSPEALFHNRMMMMAHHNHHHRPLSSPFDNNGDGDGPTTYMSFTNHINLVSGASSVLGPAIDAGCGAAPPAPVRTLQPFDISSYTSSPTTTTTTFNFKPPSAGVMAASLGFPFTSAQWRELERQAMIYKYMMASVPVPHDLLTPSSRSSCMDGGFNLRLANSTDPEPGRCRRTDGKKWRCSRDVAPNHKYCERHMHRGRPRSRKPVEVNTNSTTTPTSVNNNNHQIKKARHECNNNPFATPDVTAAISNPTSRKNGSSPHFLGSTTTQPYLDSSLSLDNFGLKAASFDSVASVSANKEPR